MIEGFEPSSRIILNLVNPREKFFGILGALSPAGITVRAINLDSFEDWVRQIAHEEEPNLGLITMFVPLFRVERIFLDEPKECQTAQCPRLVLMIAQTSGAAQKCGPRAFRGFELAPIVRDPEAHDLSIAPSDRIADCIADTLTALHAGERLFPFAPADEVESANHVDIRQAMRMIDAFGRAHRAFQVAPRDTVQSAQAERAAELGQRTA